MNTTYLDNYFHKNPSFNLIRKGEISRNQGANLNAKRKVQFRVVHLKNGSTFEIDSENKISRVAWNGVIDVKTVEDLVKSGADSVEHGTYNKLLLDRSNLLEFTTEARVWMKGLLKNRATKIVDMVEKVAIVKATTLKGNVFSNFIGAAVRIVMPKLEMREFDSEKEAINWLTNAR